MKKYWTAGVIGLLFFGGLRVWSMPIESRPLFVSILSWSLAIQETSTTRPNEEKPPKEAPKALTPEEAFAEIEKKLNQSLQEFDGALLREKELLREKRPEGAQASNAGGAQNNKKGGNGKGGGSGKSGGKDGQSEGAESNGDQNADASSEGNSAQSGRTGKDSVRGKQGTGKSKEKGSAVKGAGSGKGSAEIPPDIPNGRNDDIVARQLREAAMKEKDPALREKLWEEYRKYKGISSKKVP